MDLWHPRAQRVIPTDGHTGLTIFDGVRPKIVLHTTSGSAGVSGTNANLPPYIALWGWIRY